MLFNPEESIDFQGNTGPFVQYTHARICSMIRKAKDQAIDFQIQSVPNMALSSTEQELIFLLGTYKAKIEEAAAQYSPAIITQYTYEVAKQFNKLYNELSILNEEDGIKRNIRLTLAELTGKTIREAFELLGIQSPERM